MFNEQFTPSIPHSTIRVLVSEANGAERTFPLHFHREYELFYAQKGGRAFYTDREEALLKEGDILLVGRGVPHRTLAPAKGEGILLQFDYDPPLAEQEFFLPQAGAPLTLFEGGSPQNEELRGCMERIAAEYQGGGEAADLYIRALTLQIIACLRRAGAIADPAADPARYAALRPALEYIHAHFSENLSLAAVSGKLHLERAHFCRVFKQAMGMPFLQYLHRLRIYHAERLLEQTDLPIARIAEQVGFCSAAYFTETFRKIHGRSPREYRKLQMDQKI